MGWSTIAADKFELVHSFNSASGLSPQAALTLAKDGNFYGTTCYGGSNGGWGTLFRMTPKGMLATLASFGHTNGAYPQSRLTLGIDGKLYGTTTAGGNTNFPYSNGMGTVFQMDLTNGILKTLAVFAGTNGAMPNGLTPGTDGTLYGTTLQGGTNFGTVFKITADGTLTTLAVLSATQANPSTLTLGTDGNLYGTTSFGGSARQGSVFMVTAKGIVSTLFSFKYGDACRPVSGLTLGSDGELYGTTSYGPSSARFGSVFRIATNGTLTTLHSFSLAGGGGASALTLGDDGALYGVTRTEGTGKPGTVFSILPSGRFTTLLSFTQSTYRTYPKAELTLGTDGSFYGTTTTEQNLAGGTIFRVTKAGVATTLVSFGFPGGAAPTAELTAAPDGAFYGTASSGGENGLGTVYRLLADGTFATLASFNGTNGQVPYGAVVMGPDDKLYGTTAVGGRYKMGTIFCLTTNGTLTTLVHLAFTNGAAPYARLTPGPDGALYGTTFYGGRTNSLCRDAAGTIFRISTNGTFTTLAALDFTNGAYPRGQLVFGPDRRLYGTATDGGKGHGTVFVLMTNNAVLALASFNGTNGGRPAGLTLGEDGAFYGTATEGGQFNRGAVFRVTTNGILSTLVSFNETNGASPRAALILAKDGNFYGTTSSGDFNNNGGTVFQLTANGSLITLTGLPGWISGPGRLYAALTASRDGKLYGTTSSGGPNGSQGIVFRIPLPLNGEKAPEHKRDN